MSAPLSPPPLFWRIRMSCTVRVFTAICLSALLPWLTGATYPGKTLTSKDLQSIRGGAVCQSAVLDGKTSGCTGCEQNPPGSGQFWKGCEDPDVYKCAPAQSSGFRPVCNAVQPACGGVQVKQATFECNEAADPPNTRTCTLIYNSATTGFMGGGNCP